VLILPPGHAHTLGAPRQLGRREKWMIGAVLGLVAAGIVALVISLASGGHTSSTGCVDVTAPGATGATELYRCGAQARELCASGGASATVNGEFGLALARACRKAGLAVSR
jgi:hypothetical protein